MSVFPASSLSTSDMSFNRRVKPLPKRRRTSFQSSEGDGPGPTVDTSHTPSYYHPINSSRVNKLKGEFNATPLHPRLINKPSLLSSRPRIINDADGECDYADHLQQPNNTKKRKVPTTTTTGPAAQERTIGHDPDYLAGENAPASRVNLSRKASSSVVDGLGPREFDFQPTTTTHRKPRSSVTLATLRLKELLKTRREMVMATIRDGVNPLALEFALSAPFARSPGQQSLHAWSYGPKFRRRPGNRVLPIPGQESCFSGQFTFSVPSPISKRYTAAKKAAAGLQVRFQTELARQATNAAETALQTAPQFPSNPSSDEPRKTDSGLAHAQVPSSGPSTDKVPKKSSKAKKKKRSALANASNPHHLRNYVPSRVSQGGHSVPLGHGQSRPSDSLGPLALKFLSATLPPRRKGRALGDNLGPSLVRPESEWICPFCEYNLFYGDDDAMHRAVKNRRRVLARRRKARERAAAAASGVIAPRSQDVSEDEAETDEDEDEESLEEGSDIVPTPVLPRRDGTVGVRQDTHGPHPGG